MALKPLQETPEQQAICGCPDRLLVIEANAGAGKTTTAAMKVRDLVRQGADPSRIIVLSFTRPGVEAFSRAFGRVGLDRATIKALRVGTFEDFCAARLKRTEGVGVPRHERPEDVRDAVLAAIPTARAWAEDRHPGAFSLHGTGELAVEGLLSVFAHLKGTLQLQREADRVSYSPAGAAELGRDFTALAIYRAYERERRPTDGDGAQARFRFDGDATFDLARLIDGDDAPWGWEDHPMRLGLEAIVLDEMHDTNWAMFTVLQELLRVNEAARFIGVGDRDQVIHAQSGADSRLMGEDFDRYIGKPTRLPLTRSHRFGPAIARPLAGFAGKPYPAEPAIRSEVAVRRCETPAEVLQVIHQTLGQGGGATASSLAVLLRHPSDAVELEHEMRRVGLKYETAGFTTYLRRPEVLFFRFLLMQAVRLEEKFDNALLAEAKRATVAFFGGDLRYASFQKDETSAIVGNPEVTQAVFFQHNFEQLRNSSDPRIGTQVDEAMRLAATDRIDHIAAAAAALDIQGLARRVFVNRQSAEDAQASIQSLVRAARSYETLSSFLKSLLVHDYEARADRHAEGRLLLASIEAVKGLEFDQVIIPDVNRDAFDGASADERNLFYVAASRARRRLTLTHRAGQASAYLQGFGEASAG